MPIWEFAYERTRFFNRLAGGCAIVLTVLLIVSVFFPVFTIGHPRSLRYTSTLVNLRHLGLSLQLYAERNDGRFPPDMSSAMSVKNCLLLYVENSDFFTSLNDNSPQFLGNGSLGCKKESSVVDPELAIVFFDSAPWPEGVRMVSFVDGHVKKLKEEQFQRAVANGWRLEAIGSVK